MRKLIIILFASLLFGCSHQDEVLHDTQDHVVKVSELKGKWVIINYWADWCDTCIHELPELNRFYHGNKDKNIVLYGVNYDDLPLEKLKEIVKKRHIDFPVLLEDPNTIWQFGVLDVVPTTFIVNPQGKVVEIIRGRTDKQALMQKIKNLQS